ncbi:MAG: endonuclease MutS2 [Bacteroides sp.]|nr:endonuclease MutS2 [Bacteroides sp.]
MIYPESFEHKIGFDSVRERISALCSSEAGKDWCAEMRFDTVAAVVVRKLESTAEMLRIVTSDEAIPLDGMAHVEPILKSLRVPGTFVPAADLVAVRRTLAVIADTEAFFRNHRNDEGASVYPRLDAVARMLTVFPHAAAAIDRVIDRYGNVLDNASPELAEIRRSLSSMAGTVNSALRRVMARAVADGVLEADAAPTMRDGRLVIPVAPMHKRRISGIVHDESASGKTIFIEPAEVVEINNRIRELQMDERREIARILTVVADTLRPNAGEILASVGIIGELDFIRAKARYASETGGVLPHFSEGPELEWYHACHPGLLMSLRRQGREIVPLDIRLTPKERILVISGPNAGGKSVCLKTVGVVQYMMQCGLLPPVYENSHVGVFEDIFIDIGDDQSIEDDLSTYSSHLRNMKFFLSKGRSTSLVLIDEFGGGTEPQIGGAIAQAILHQFNDAGMWGVITTHYQNLKHFAEDTEGLVNGSMLYDRHLMQPLFKLSIGNPGSSFAIEIARKTGLPAHIISEAEEIVGSDYVNMDKYLLDIARDRKYWDNKRTSIRQKEKKLEELLAKYEADAESLREKRREIISDARDEARRIIEGTNAEIEKTIKEIRESQADRQRTLEARRNLEKEKQKLLGDNGKADRHPALGRVPGKKKKKERPQAPKAESNRPLKVGDIVKLDGEGTPGKILEIDGKNAVVAFGMLKTSVKLDRLKPTQASIPSGAGKSASFISSSTSDSMRDRQLNFSRDIDVRGMRVDEALQAITYFIDDAIQFSAERVRILHGTGTGALRQAIRQYLDTVRGVRAYRDEHVQFGGAGITVVDLE